jgi:hypothetical protein
MGTLGSASHRPFSLANPLPCSWLERQTPADVARFNGWHGDPLPRCGRTLDENLPVSRLFVTVVFTPDFFLPRIFVRSPAMLRAPVTLSMLLALAFASSGCQSNRRAIQPSGETTVALDPKTRHAEAKTKLQFEITLELPAPKARGFVWQLIQADARFVGQTAEIEPVPGTDRSSISFIALHTGRTILRFIAIPPTPAPEADPGDSYDVRLIVE